MIIKKLYIFTQKQLNIKMIFIKLITIWQKFKKIDKKIIKKLSKIMKKQLNLVKIISKGIID